MVRTLGAATVLLLCAAAAAGQTRGDERFRRELLRAEALERAGQLTLALAAVDSLLTVAPAEPAALLLAERVYRRLGRLDALPPVLDRALRLDPSAVLVWQMALRTLSELGRFEEFRAAGERWLRLTPASAVAYREYATALRRIGEPAEAEVVLRRGQTQVDRPEVLAVELADLYRDQGRWSEAAQSWVALLEVSASFALDLIVSKLERAGVDSRPLAVALLRLIEDESSLEARELAALAALYAGRSDVSRQSAELVMGGLDRRARQLFVGRFAKTAEEQGHPALSAWAYRELMRDVEEDAARWELARLVVKYDIAAGDTADALATLEEMTGSASPKSGAHRWASVELIRTLASVGEVGRAGRALELHARLYRNDPELPALALAVAAANLRLGHLEESRQVLELVPVATGASALAGRMAATAAQLALYSGDYTAAREAFERAVPTLAGEERSEALRLLRFLRDGNEAELMAVAAAHRRARQEEWVAAFDALRAGLQRAPPSRARPALLLWSAELALAGAELEQAATMLNLIVARYPRAGEAPVALMRLAEALAGDGRGLEAIALLEDLILRYPDSALTPVARRRLAELREEVPRS